MARTTNDQVVKDALSYCRTGRKRNAGAVIFWRRSKSRRARLDWCSREAWDSQDSYGELGDVVATCSPVGIYIVDEWRAGRVLSQWVLDKAEGKDTDGD